MFNFTNGRFGQIETERTHSCATLDELSRDDLSNPVTRNTICTNPNVVKYISINFHFIADDYGSNNFSKNHDGQGNPNYTGYDRAEDLVNSMNVYLNQNQQMRLPCGNSTAVLPVRIQYVLKGVYFHNSTDYTNDGVFDWSVHNAHAVNPNTEINIYLINRSQWADGVAWGIGSSNNLAVKT